MLVVREEGRRWIAVVGIPLSTKPGPQKLEVRAATGNHEERFSVGSKHYREQRITLKNKRQVNPLPEDLKRIERELAEQTAAYRRFSPGLPSNLMLDKPVDGPLSSPFGLRRFFNGEERNPHSGLDFAVPAGTPIKAPAAGKVILIGDYFFNGKTVFVDHGQGFISMFCHLSKIDVKLGQQGARRRTRQGRRHRQGHRTAHALERQPERRASRPGDLHRCLPALRSEQRGAG